MPKPKGTVCDGAAAASDRESSEEQTVPVGTPKAKEDEAEAH